MEYHSYVMWAGGCRWWAFEAQTLRRCASCLSPPLEFTGIFHLWSLTCQRSLRNGTLSAFVDEFASILHLFIRAICGETTWTLTVFSRIFPKSESRKLYVLPMALSPKTVLKISCVSHPVYPSLKPSSIHILCFFNQSSENSILHITPATIKPR
jgi:hypothetical protein